MVNDIMKGILTVYVKHHPIAQLMFCKLDCGIMTYTIFILFYYFVYMKLLPHWWLNEEMQIPRLLQVQVPQDLWLYIPSVRILGLITLG